MVSDDEITINFTEEQQKELIQKCGFTPKPIVTNCLSLVMLSLAASARKSEVLPLVNHISTCNQILDRQEKETSGESLYTITLELSKEQREIIGSIVKKDWQKIIITPDDYIVNFKEDWSSETSILKVGKHFVIVSEEIAYTPLPDEIVITLPKSTNTNNSTFGTGHHPTTQMMLYLLKKYMKTGCSVLDVGTGSGILAIAAAKLGTDRILAIDVDSTAIETAKKMAELNNVRDKIQFGVGTIDLVTDTFDLIVANLFPNIIISIANLLPQRINENGLLIVSGLVSVRIPEVTHILEEAGFECLKSKTINYWGGIVFQKKS